VATPARDIKTPTASIPTHSLADDCLCAFSPLVETPADTPFSRYFADECRNFVCVFERILLQGLKKLPGAFPMDCLGDLCQLSIGGCPKPHVWRRGTTHAGGIHIRTLQRYELTIVFVSAFAQYCVSWLSVLNWL
jgi:hypothetical protein